MSAQGQSRRFGDVRVTSALPLKADIHRKVRYVSKVPIGDVARLLRPKVSARKPKSLARNNKNWMRAFSKWSFAGDLKPGHGNTDAAERSYSVRGVVILDQRRHEMGDERKQSGDRRKTTERRSGKDARSEEEKRLTGERRSGVDRRSGKDRRAKGSDTPKRHSEGQVTTAFET